MPQRIKTPPSLGERRRALLTMAGLPLVSAPWLSDPARAQDGFPTRPIRLVCPYAAGSPVDVAGRYMAERLQKSLGTTLVENLPGAGGTTGTASVLKAAADGHTLLTQFTSALVTTQFLYKSVTYDVLKDFVPIWSIGSAGTVLVVSGNSPYRTLKDFLDAARTSPGKVTVGNAGTGSTPHMNAIMFMRHTGVEFSHVPYKGSGQVISDILGGHLDSLFASIASAAPLIADGRLRGLAVLRSERVPELPGVPTLAEAGVVGWEPPRSTFGLFAPAGTPKAVVTRIQAALIEGHEADKEAQARLAKIGLRGTIAGDDLSRLLHSEYTLFKKLIEDANIPAVG